MAATGLSMSVRRDTLRQCNNDGAVVENFSCFPNRTMWDFCVPFLYLLFSFSVDWFKCV